MKSVFLGFLIVAAIYLYAALNLRMGYRRLL
jgi:hypothetical protein